jgi:hypothetical protein
LRGGEHTHMRGGGSEWAGKTAQIRGTPKGFRTELAEDGRTLTVRNRAGRPRLKAAGCGCALVPWTALGVMSLTWLFSEQGLRQSHFVLMLWVLGWALGEATGVWYVLKMLLGRSVVRLGMDSLDVEDVFLRWRRGWSAGRREITQVVRRTFTDREVGETYHHLEVWADRQRPILRRDTYERTEWLGNLLAAWSGAPFLSGGVAPGPSVREQEGEEDDGA